MRPFLALLSLALLFPLHLHHPESGGDCHAPPTACAWSRDDHRIFGPSHRDHPESFLCPLAHLAAAHQVPLSPLRRDASPGPEEAGTSSSGHRSAWPVRIRGPPPASSHEVRD